MMNKKSMTNKIPGIKLEDKDLFFWVYSCKWRVCLVRIDNKFSHSILYILQYIWYKDKIKIVYNQKLFKGYM